MIVLTHTINKEIEVMYRVQFCGESKARVFMSQWLHGLVILGLARSVLVLNTSISGVSDGGK